MPANEVARLRVTMAEEGLPSGGSVGYEIFDRAEGLGTTNFVQSVNHLRALEGELARTIRSIGLVKQAREQGEDATRFVLDMALSRLGDMQLDGLVRDLHFDLILRTRRPLPEPMRRDMTDIFNEANGAAGHQGQIGFQASDDWAFMPLKRGGHAVPEMLV